MPIKKKWIGLNAVDGERILLDNAESLRAKNAAGSAEELMKLDSSDVLQFLKLPRVAVDPSDSNDLARKSYVDQEVESSESGLQDQIDAHETRISTAEGEIDTLQTEVDALETSVGVLNGNSSQEGSVEYKIAQSVNALLDNAPEAYDTLKEIADYIEADQTGAAAMTAQLNDHENRLDTLEGDSSVVNSVDYKVAAEAALRSSADTNLQTQITQEISDREAAITALEGQVEELASGLVEDQIVDGVTGKAPSQNAVFDALALKATQSDLDDLDGYAQDIRSDHDALEARVDQAEIDIDAVEASVALKLNASEVGVSVASLVAGKVPATQIPALALVETYVVSSEAEMLALSEAEQGDVAVRSDLSKSFVLSQNGVYSQLSSWIELLAPTYDPSGIQSQLDALDSRIDQAELDIEAAETAIANEASARQSADAQTLVDANAYTDSEIGALPIERMTYESKVLGAQDVANQYIDVQHEIQAQPMIQVNRVWLAPADDFTVTGSRIDFATLQGTEEALEAGDKLHIWYCRSNSSSGGGGGEGGGGGGGELTFTPFVSEVPAGVETLIGNLSGGTPPYLDWGGTGGSLRIEGSLVHFTAFNAGTCTFQINDSAGQTIGTREILAV